MPNVTRRRRALRLPRRYTLRSPIDATPFVVWTGLPFVKWLTGHDCLTVYDVVLAAPHSLRAETVAHEWCHVWQWRMYGIVGFLRRYLRQAVKGYDTNDLERAARAFASMYREHFSAIGA